MSLPILLDLVFCLLLLKFHNIFHFSQNLIIDGHGVKSDNNADNPMLNVTQAFEICQLA